MASDVARAASASIVAVMCVRALDGWDGVVTVAVATVVVAAAADDGDAVDC